MGQTITNYQDVAISPAVGFTVAETKEAYEAKPQKRKLLIDEPPLQLLPTLACFIGDRHATLLQQLLYLQNNLQGEVDEFGNKWVRVVIDGTEKITWCKIMPYLERNTIRNILEDLEGEGFIKSRNFTGRPLYYRVDIMAVDNLTEPVARISKSKKRGGRIIKGIIQNLDDKSNIQLLDDNHPNFGQSSSNNWTNNIQNLDTSETHKESPKNTTDSQGACDIFSPLAIVMANTLKLDLSIKKNLDCVNLTLDKLNALYQDDVTEANIIKVGNLVFKKWGASPARVFSQWSNLLAKPETTEVELKAKELQAQNEAVSSRIKAICKPPCLMGWEHQSVKAKKKLLNDLSASIVINHQESKLDSFTWWGGNEKPSIEQFNKAWVDHVTKGETNNVSTKNSNNQFTVPTEGRLARVAVI